MASEPYVQPDGLVQETQFTSSNVEYGTYSSVASGGPEATVEEDRDEVPQPPKMASRALGPDLLRAIVVVLEALDHAAGGLIAWRHGTGLENEEDGKVVTQWNTTTGFIARTLTHICAPGFMFLLGLGIVYFGRSRTKLGWSRWRFLKHFFVRAMVLTALNQVLGLIDGQGYVWLLNMVLLALAVDYLLAGMLWLVLRDTEAIMADVMEQLWGEPGQPSGETRPLLANADTPSSPATASRAEAISFHWHSALLLCIASVTIWWDVWFSPNGGHCKPRSEDAGGDPITSLGIPSQSPSLFDFMFRVAAGGKVLSVFPPLGWISFAILGLLYGRYLLRYQRPASSVATVTALLGVIFAALFVRTRLQHVGNLSEDCLQTPENIAHPDSNQYLVSWRAFFYVVKYPPSPAYMFYTMAVNFFLLAAFTALPVLPAKEPGNEVKEAWHTRILRLLYAIMLPFGQCALFFYCLHYLVYIGLSVPLNLWFGHDMGFRNPWTDHRQVGVGNGVIFWLYYFFGLAILWLACRRYARFKASKGPDSIWRFF